MTPPLSLEEAQERLLSGVTPLGSETLPIDRALGRWSAKPVVAQRSSPQADLSAMDGYATGGIGPWRIVGESAAGHPFGQALEAGEAVRISTGALVPSGAEAILISEEAQVDSLVLTAASGAPTAAYIRRAGFDFAAGEAVISAGTRVGPVQLSLALAAGAKGLAVGRLPSLAIIDTGNELVRNGSEPRLGMVPATNGRMLAALCASTTSSIELIGPIPDERSQLRAAFDRASAADVIVTTGGASVGEHDLVRPELEAWGAELDFWRVAIRPGKPLLVARKGAQHIVGLPGNPVSAYVTALLFVQPLLRRLAGAPLPACVPRTISAPLAAPAPAGGPRREFLRARWTDQGVEPLAERDSSALRSLAAAHVLIDRPAEAMPAACGDLVSVIPLEHSGIA